VNKANPSVEYANIYAGTSQTSPQGENLTVPNAARGGTTQCQILVEGLNSTGTVLISAAADVKILTP